MTSGQQQLQIVRRLVMEYLKEVRSTSFQAVIFYCLNSFERPRESDVRTGIWSLIGDGSINLKELELTINK